MVFYQIDFKNYDMLNNAVETSLYQTTFLHQSVALTGTIRRGDRGEMQSKGSKQSHIQIYSHSHIK